MEFQQLYLLYFQPQFFWILTNTEQEVNGNDLCGTMFVGFGCDSKNPDRIWEVTMPDVEKPEVVEPSNPVSN